LGFGRVLSVESRQDVSPWPALEDPHIDRRSFGSSPLSSLHRPKPVRLQPTTADEETGTGGLRRSLARKPMSRYISQVPRDSVREERLGRVCLSRPAPSYTVAIPSLHEFSRRAAHIRAKPLSSRWSPCPFRRPLRPYGLLLAQIQGSLSDALQALLPPDWSWKGGSQHPHGAGGRRIGRCCSCHGCVHGSDELGGEGGDDFGPTTVQPLTPKSEANLSFA
jgi:hypothetical protein